MMTAAITPLIPATRFVLPATTGRALIQPRHFEADFFLRPGERDYFLPLLQRPALVSSPATANPCFTDLLREHATIKAIFIDDTQPLSPDLVLTKQKVERDLAIQLSIQDYEAIQNSSDAEFDTLATATLKTRLGAYFETLSERDLTETEIQDLQETRIKLAEHLIRNRQTPKEQPSHPLALDDELLLYGILLELNRAGFSKTEGFGSNRAWNLPRDLVALQPWVITLFRHLQNHSRGTGPKDKLVRADAKIFLPLVDGGAKYIEGLYSMMSQYSVEYSELKVLNKKESAIRSNPDLSESQKASQLSELKQNRAHEQQKTYRFEPWWDQSAQDYFDKLDTQDGEDELPKILLELTGQIHLLEQQLEQAQQSLQQSPSYKLAESPSGKSTIDKSSPGWEGAVNLSNQIREIRLQISALKTRIDAMERASQFPLYSYVILHGLRYENPRESTVIDALQDPDHSDWIKRATAHDAQTATNPQALHPIFDLDFSSSWASRVSGALKRRDALFTTWQNKEAEAARQDYKYPVGTKPALVAPKPHRDDDSLLSSGIQNGKLAYDRGTFVYFYHRGFKTRFLVPTEAFDENGALKEEFVLMAPCLPGGGTKHSNVNAMVYTAENIFAQTLKHKDGSEILAPNGKPARILPVIFDHAGAPGGAPARDFFKEADYENYVNDVLSWLHGFFVHPDGGKVDRLAIGRSLGAQVVANMRKRHEWREFSPMFEALIHYGAYKEEWSRFAVRYLFKIDIEGLAARLGITAEQIKTVDAKPNLPQLGLIFYWDGLFHDGVDLARQLSAGEIDALEPDHLTDSNLSAWERNQNPQWLIFKDLEDRWNKMLAAESSQGLSFHHEELADGQPLTLSQILKLDWNQLSTNSTAWDAVHDYFALVREKAGITVSPIPSMNMYGSRDDEYPRLTDPETGIYGTLDLWPMFAATSGTRLWMGPAGHDPMDARRSDPEITRVATDRAVRFASDHYLGATASQGT